MAQRARGVSWHPGGPSASCQPAAGKQAAPARGFAKSRRIARAFLYRRVYDSRVCPICLVGPIILTVRGSTSKSVAVTDGRYRQWLNRFAWLTCIATLLLICSGGMVTSKNVGLAVPDWPTTFGYNMFLFPVSKWVGGILFEHTHRLIASAVGFLTIILAIWLWRSEDRKWVRNLGVIALGLVILQGVLGGLRVTMLKDEIGIFHACLAQGFLALLVVIALVTTKFWRSLSNVVIAPKKMGSITTLAIVITLAIYAQLALGATMRHQHRDLAILDFPTANGAWIPDTSTPAIAKINV